MAVKSCKPAMNMDVFMIHTDFILATVRPGTTTTILIFDRDLLLLDKLFLLADHCIPLFDTLLKQPGSVSSLYPLGSIAG